MPIIDLQPGYGRGVGGAQPPASLSLTFTGVEQYAYHEELVAPYMGLDATVVGYDTYRTMRDWGINVKGYHLTSGFEERRGKADLINIPKVDLFSKMIAAWDRGWIKVGSHIPHADALREEAAAFRWKMTQKRQQLTVEHERERDHDDLLTALSCAVETAYRDIDSWKRRAWTGLIMRGSGMLDEAI